MTHTPGPWLLATSNSWRRFVSQDGKSVCEPVTYSARDHHPDLYFRNGGEDGPDARLLAAAPELLAALRMARAALHTAMHEPVNETGRQVLARRIASADAAIVKATGGRHDLPAL